MKSPMEKMAERVNEAVLAAAFMMEGMHTADYEAYLAYTDETGAIEKADCAITHMAQLIGLASVFAMDNDMIDGVFHYEVSAEYGARYAVMAIEESRALTRPEEIELLRQVLLEYFMEATEDKVYALFVEVGIVVNIPTGDEDDE